MQRRGHLTLGYPAMSQFETCFVHLNSNMVGRKQRLVMCPRPDLSLFTRLQKYNTQIYLKKRLNVDPPAQTGDVRGNDFV